MFFSSSSCSLANPVANVLFSVRVLVTSVTRKGEMHLWCCGVRACARAPVEGNETAKNAICLGRNASVRKGYKLPWPRAQMVHVWWCVKMVRIISTHMRFCTQNAANVYACVRTSGSIRSNVSGMQTCAFWCRLHIACGECFQRLLKVRNEGAWCVQLMAEYVLIGRP